MTNKFFGNFTGSIIIGSLFIASGILGACSSSEKKSTDSQQVKETAEANKKPVDDGKTTPEPQGNPMADAKFKMTKSGMMIVGEGSEIRAFSPFRSGEHISTPYIKLANDFKKEFPDINIYAMVIPGQSAYYVPKAAEGNAKPMKPAFDYIKANLDPGVKYVDVYGHLAGHTKENIFLRTDHHWAPLGAYYAARALAAVADVPFKDLSEYDEHVVHGYVGSMYHYTNDIDIKNNPEDFYYYTPRGTKEKTTYVAYIKNKDSEKLTERGPYEGEFFHHYGDGAGGAYCTFMGGDHFNVKVETGVPNSRRLLVIKDSHGNPIPAYLFHSFEEIHVIDYRYFTKNLKKYIADNKISDIALAFGINTSSASGNMQKVRNFLTQ